MDRSLAETHASFAWATMGYGYDFETVEREFERAIALDARVTFSPIHGSEPQLDGAF